MHFNFFVKKKKWLEEALTNMNIDPAKEMKKCMKCLLEESDEERQIQALETLRDWCEDMNFAIDFHKMKGIYRNFLFINFMSNFRL